MQLKYVTLTQFTEIITRPNLNIEFSPNRILLVGKALKGAVGQPIFLSENVNVEDVFGEHEALNTNQVESYFNTTNELSLSYDILVNIFQVPKSQIVLLRIGDVRLPEVTVRNFNNNRIIDGSALYPKTSETLFQFISSEYKERIRTYIDLENSRYDGAKQYLAPNETTELLDFMGLSSATTTGITLSDFSEIDDTFVFNLFGLDLERTGTGPNYTYRNIVNYFPTSINITNFSDPLFSTENIIPLNVNNIDLNIFSPNYRSVQRDLINQVGINKSFNPVINNQEFDDGNINNRFEDFVANMRVPYEEIEGKIKLYKDQSVYDSAILNTEYNASVFTPANNYQFTGYNNSNGDTITKKELTIANLTAITEDDTKNQLIETFLDNVRITNYASTFLDNDGNALEPFISLEQVQSIFSIDVEDALLSRGNLVFGEAVIKYNFYKIRNKKSIRAKVEELSSLGVADESVEYQARSQKISQSILQSDIINENEVTDPTSGVVTTVRNNSIISLEQIKNNITNKGFSPNLKFISIISIKDTNDNILDPAFYSINTNKSSITFNYSDVNFPLADYVVEYELYFSLNEAYTQKDLIKSNPFSFFAERTQIEFGANLDFDLNIEYETQVILRENEDFELVLASNLKMNYLTFNFVLADINSGPENIASAFTMGETLRERGSEERRIIRFLESSDKVRKIKDSIEKANGYYELDIKFIKSYSNFVYNFTSNNNFLVANSAIDNSLNDIKVYQDKVIEILKRSDVQDTKYRHLALLDAYLDDTARNIIGENGENIPEGNLNWHQRLNEIALSQSETNSNPIVPLGIRSPHDRRSKLIDHSITDRNAQKNIFIDNVIKNQPDLKASPANLLNDQQYRHIVPIHGVLNYVQGTTSFPLSPQLLLNYLNYKYLTDGVAREAVLYSHINNNYEFYGTTTSSFLNNIEHDPNFIVGNVLEANRYISSGWNVFAFDSVSNRFVLYGNDTLANRSSGARKLSTLTSLGLLIDTIRYKANNDLYGVLTPSHVNRIVSGYEVSANSVFVSSLNPKFREISIVIEFDDDQFNDLNFRLIVDYVGIQEITSGKLSVNITTNSR